MITSAIKKQTSVVLFHYIHIWYFKLEKSKKESNSIVNLLLMSAALPIAPFICEHCL